MKSILLVPGIEPGLRRLKCVGVDKTTHNATATTYAEWSFKFSTKEFVRGKKPWRRFSRCVIPRLILSMYLMMQ